MGLSRNYFDGVGEVPTFIGADNQEMDLFSFVKLKEPKQATIGVRPLREGEQPLLEVTAGHLTVFGAASGPSPAILVPPVQSVAPIVEPVQLEEIQAASSGSIEVLEAGAENLKRKAEASSSGTSKRRRHVVVDEESSAESEKVAASAYKDAVEASPPREPVGEKDDFPLEGADRVAKAAEGTSAQGLLRELAATTGRQAELIAQLEAQHMGESSLIVEKDMEIERLRAQLGEALAEAESAKAREEKIAQDKVSMLADLRYAKGKLREMQADKVWSVRFLNEKKDEHVAHVEQFRERMEKLVQMQEEKLRALSIEYDEELYPHLMSTIAERRWLISHGLRLAALGTLESPEVVGTFAKVVECAMERGKAQAMEELHEAKVFTTALTELPGYNADAYNELLQAMEGMKLLELPHIARLERDQDQPISVIMAGLTLERHSSEGADDEPDFFLKPDESQLQVPVFVQPRHMLNPFALEKEVPLKEVLEKHAERAARKKGVKGKAIMCGVGAAHIPRSDGVPVSVPTVSPKDALILHKVQEARSSAAPEDSPEHRHSI